MKGYEVTERGKFIIVVLVIALLIIPATVIAFRVWSSSQPLPSDDPGQHIAQPTPDGSGQDDPEPGEIENPPPDGSEPDPADPPDEGNSEQGSFDPPVEPPDDTDDPENPVAPGDDELPDEPPKIGPVGINRNAGTMQFMFAPEHQDALDPDTLSMLGEFVDSPGNTKDSFILVKIPSLPAEKNSILTSAIIDAFSQQGIARRTLSFETYQSNSDDDSFEIRLSFTPTSSPK